MNNYFKSSPNLTNIIRWIARILSVVSIGIILLFMAGEGFDYTQIKLSEWLLFIFFPIGVSIGMVLAWWQEGIGGIITVGSFIMFYAVHFVISGRFPHGLAFLVFTIPGFLFLLCWYRIRKIHSVAA
jgi:hypothetical protein